MNALIVRYALVIPQIVEYTRGMRVETIYIRMVRKNKNMYISKITDNFGMIVENDRCHMSTYLVIQNFFSNPLENILKYSIIKYYFRLYKIFKKKYDPYFD